MTNKKLIKNNNHRKLIFTVSAPRSGSTLLLSYLCGIPDTKILYESKLLLVDKSLVDLANYFDHFEEEIVIEKTPEHVFHLEDIEKLRKLCKRDIYVIYIIRPPVPTILSLIKASKDSPELFGNIDLLGACEKYEESLVSIYNNLILKTNQSNYPLVKIPVDGKDVLGNTVKIDSYEDRRFIPYSFCVSYRELIEDPYQVVSNLLNLLYIEAEIQSLIDSRISNTRKYLPQVTNERHHKNVLRDIEEVEIERRAKIRKQISEGLSRASGDARLRSDKYIERSNYIRNYFEHPTTKETIYDLVAERKVLGSVTKNPLVNIIVPLYNKEKYIEETLFAIKNQTYSNYNCQIIDDGSTDNSREVVLKFLESLPYDSVERSKFTLHVVATNQGVSAARNTLLSWVLSECDDDEIIAFCDADDVWDKELVKKSVNTFNKYPYVDCVYSRVIIKKDNKYDFVYSKICNGNVFKDAIKYNFLGCGSNLFVKSQVLVKRQATPAFGKDCPDLRFNESYSGCEDWDFLIQLSKVAVFKCTKEYLVTYRQVKDSLSSNKKNQFDQGRNILSRYIEDKKQYSRLVTRLLFFYLSQRNFTWDVIKELDFRFILEVLTDKLKTLVKSYLQ